MPSQKRTQPNRMDAFLRRLRWSCIADAIMDCPSPELHQQTLRSSEEVCETDNQDSTQPQIQSWFSWLLEAPFSDPDVRVREYASRRISKVLVTESFSFLLALFSSDEDIQTFSVYLGTRRWPTAEAPPTYELLHSSDRVASGLFREVDRLLLESCGFSDSQLSFTMAKSAPGVTTQKDQIARGDRASMQRSAVRILASICRNADLGNSIGKSMFEKSFLRLVRMWAASSVDKCVDSSFPDLLSTSSNKALAFGEMVHLSDLRPLKLLLSQELSDTLTAAVVCDVLILSSSKSRETQYFLLEAFIRSCLLESSEVLANRKLAKEALSFVEEKLPTILAQLVVEKDVELLQNSSRRDTSTQ